MWTVQWGECLYSKFGKSNLVLRSSGSQVVPRPFKKDNSLRTGNQMVVPKVVDTFLYTSTIVRKGTAFPLGIMGRERPLNSIKFQGLWARCRFLQRWNQPEKHPYT